MGRAELPAGKMIAARFALFVFAEEFLITVAAREADAGRD